jgi:ribosome-interacting GTPase 1
MNNEWQNQNKNRDLPGIIEGAADGRGRGRQVISTARTCNLILIVLDASKPVTHKKIIEQELFSFGIRINQEVSDNTHLYYHAHTHMYM